jgi:hypothetical protein
VPLPLESSGCGRTRGTNNEIKQLISKRMNEQRTADKIVTKDIFSITSSQGSNMLFLNEKMEAGYI